MKKLLLGSAIFLTSCAALEEIDTDAAVDAVAADLPLSQILENSKDNVDWIGYYQAVLPCGEGCEGIAITLKLNEDLTYVLRSRQVNKEKTDTKKEGKFIWLSDNNTIQLQDNAQNTKFIIREHGAQILGPNNMDLGEAFFLRKGD